MFKKFTIKQIYCVVKNKKSKISSILQKTLVLCINSNKWASKY